LSIAIIYGHELAGSEERVLEALVVVGLAGGAVKLREDVLVAGGERLAIAARLVPLALGIAAGAGFDWLAVTGLGRAAMRYYGPGGPGAKPLLLAPENSTDVEMRR